MEETYFLGDYWVLKKDADKLQKEVERLKYKNGLLSERIKDLDKVAEEKQ